LAVLWLVALILALAPGAALLWYIRRMDKYEPEPWNMIGLAFFAGCLSVIPALIIETVLSGVHIGGFLGTVFIAFVVAAATEEASKGALTYGFMWKKPAFNEIMDGVVYFGVGHMGFAVTENLKYVFIESGGNVVQGLMNAFVRSTTAVPLHVIVGMIMGYHMGMARYARTPQERIKNYLQAFAWPVLLHGFYDLAAFSRSAKVQDVSSLMEVGFGSALMYVAVVALWLVLLPRIKRAQELSFFKPQESPTMPVAPTACPNCGSAYPLGANYCQNCAAPVPQQQQQAYYQQAPGAQ
jgi:RsiW-degrading membrane proteinase PrsW (M82 family)